MIFLFVLLLANHSHHVHAFSADDPSAFLFADEFYELMNTYETLSCYANPLEGGHGSMQATTIKVPMFLVQRTIEDYAAKSVPSDQYHTSLRSQLKAGMKIAFDSILYEPFNWLNHRDDVHDSFFGLSFPDDTGPLAFLCVEYMAIQHRFDVVLPFHTWIETRLNRRYTSDVLEAHFGVAFVFPNPYIVNTYTNKDLFSQWLVSQEMGLFTPSVYSSKYEVVYPCLVKVG